MNLTVKFSESDSTSKATLYTSDEVFDAAIGLGNSKAGNLTEAKGIVEARLYSSDQEMTAHMEVGGGMGGVKYEAGENISIEKNVISVVTTDEMESDNTKPITSAGVYAQVGNINAILATI